MTDVCVEKGKAIGYVPNRECAKNSEPRQHSGSVSKKKLYGTVTRQAKRIFGNRVPEMFELAKKCPPLFSFLGRLRYNVVRWIKRIHFIKSKRSFDVYIRKYVEGS